MRSYCAQHIHVQTKAVLFQFLGRESVRKHTFVQSYESMRLIVYCPLEEFHDSEEEYSQLPGVQDARDRI